MTHGTGKQISIDPLINPNSTPTPPELGPQLLQIKDFLIITTAIIIIIIFIAVIILMIFAVTLWLIRYGHAGLWH